jgi:hypothetical protein
MLKRIFQNILKLSIVCILSCADEEPLSFCSDPVGSDAYSATHEGWICFLPEINGCFMFQSSTPSWITSIAVQGHVRGTIADTGFASCLGDIKEKPASGYANSVEAELNHGYVVKFPDNTYARFFIASIEKNSSGKITQINITRQYGF